MTDSSVKGLLYNIMCKDPAGILLDQMRTYTGSAVLLCLPFDKTVASACQPISLLSYSLAQCSHSTVSCRIFWHQGSGNYQLVPR